jgi:hypothetical protein
MMKKIACSVLLIMLFAIDNDLFSQQMTPTEITEYMCKYKWFLRRYEWKDKFFTVPKEHQGSYMVFLPQGKVYYHKKGERQSDQPRYDWKVSGDKILITTHEGMKGIFGFELAEFIGYKINITETAGQYKGMKYVWEQASEVQDEDRVSNTKTVSSTIGTVKGTNPNFDYSKLGNLVDSLNKLIRSAYINFQKPSYSFSITGQNSNVHSSIQFFEQDNQMYIRMNIPQKGDCDYGRKEIKAILTQQYGSGPDRFYIAFKYKYSCDPNTYETIYANFYRRDNEQKEAVWDAVQRYCPK